MTTPVYFTVSGDWTGFSTGSSVNGWVTFTPVFKQGEIAVITGSPSLGVVPSPVKGRIVGGVLYADTVFGLNVATALPQVQLMANSGLNITGDFFYEVTFYDIAVAGVPSGMAPFAFKARTDTTPVDLLTVTPAPSGLSPTGYSKGDQGYSFAGIQAVSGGTALQGLMESADGSVAVGSPADISAALAAGAATVLAEDSTVTTAAIAAVALAIQGAVGSGLHYRGLWNANTNSPTLVDGTGTAGDQWLVTTAGTRSLGSGAQTFAAGDYAVYNGTTWQQVPASLILAAGQVLKHGSNASYSRPGGAPIVVWAGTVGPSNAVDGDMWADYSGTVPSFSTTTLNSLSLGVGFDQFLIATGTTPITFTVTTGSLPAGLVLSSAGELSGTPTASGAYNFTVTATNGYGTGTQNFTGTVGAAIAPTITTTALGGTPTAGVAYSQPLVATGSSPLTWTVNSGSLPTGLSLSSSTGVISGTPSSSGAYSFTIRATNSVSYDDQAFSGSVTGTAPSITTASLSALSQGTPFSQTPSVTGTTPITWSITAGTIPAGLSQDTGTGQIFGTPTSSGSYSFTVTATNSYGSTSQLYTGTIPAATPVITTTGSLNSIWRAFAFTQTLVATGASPITWSVTTGSLPSGLTLGSSTGVLSGTATATGSYSFTVTATNSYGSTTQAYSGSVLQSTPVITTSSLSTMTVTTAFTQTLAATGGPTLTWSVLSGSLPTGLSLNSSTGVLSGTPTTSAAYSFTIRATNGTDNGDQAYSGTVSTLGINFRAASTPATSTNSVADSSVAGDTCIVWVQWGNNTASTISASHSTGVTMTQVGSSVFIGNIASTNQYAAAFRYVSTGPGTVTTTPATGTVARIHVISYTGVRSVGSTLTSTSGSTGTGTVTLALNSVPSATGHVVANFLTNVQSIVSFASYSQTQRSYVSSANIASVAGDAPGASTVSFSVSNTGSSSGKWGGLAVDLLP